MLTCESCSAGKYTNGKGSITCTPCEVGKYQTDSGATECVPCPPGYAINVTGRTQCLPCAANTIAVGEENRVCTECPLGAFQSLVAQTICNACPEGYEGQRTDPRCVPCPVNWIKPLAGPGKCERCLFSSYTSSLGATECLPCENSTSDAAAAACALCLPGSFGDPTTSGCKRCEKGKYKAFVTTGSSECTLCEPGRYTDGEAQSQCLACKSGRASSDWGRNVSCDICPIGTDTQGETNATECTPCQPGRASALDGSARSCVQCESGKFSLTGKECRPCPTGGDCTRSGTSLLTNGAQAGFLRLKTCPKGEVTPCFASCPLEAACPGTFTDSCPLGYSGALCAVCEPGFYAWNRTCRSCQAHNAVLIVVVVLMVLAVAIISLTMAYFYQGIQSFTPAGLFKILVAFVQVMSVVETNYDIPWPPAALELMRWGKVLIFNVFDIAAFKCITPYNFYTTFTMGAIVPTAAIAGLYCFYKVGRMCGHTRVQNTCKNFSVKLMVLMVVLFYPPISIIIFQTFWCREVNGRHYLRADYAVQCYTEWHTAFQVFAAIGIVVVPVGVPVFLFIFLRNINNILNHHRDDLDEQKKTLLFTLQQAQRQAIERGEMHEADEGEANDGDGSRPQNALYGDAAALILSRKAAGDISIDKTEARIAKLMNRFGWLFQDFEDQFYWWECTELVRKQLMCTIIAYAGSGSILQIIAGLLVSILFHLLHAWANPFEDVLLDGVQHCSLAITWLTLLVGLSLRVQAFSSPRDELLVGYVVIFMYSVMLLVVLGVAIIKLIAIHRMIVGTQQRKALAALIKEREEKANQDGDVETTDGDIAVFEVGDDESTDSDGKDEADPDEDKPRINLSVTIDRGKTEGTIEMEPRESRQFLSPSETPIMRTSWRALQAQGTVASGGNLLMASPRGTLGSMLPRSSSAQCSPVPSPRGLGSGAGRLTAPLGAPTIMITPSQAEDDKNDTEKKQQGMGPRKTEERLQHDVELAFRQLSVKHGEQTSTSQLKATLETQNMRKLKERFLQADNNGDGRIDLAEFVNAYALLFPSKARTANEKAIRAHFKRIDVDGNEEIGWAELVLHEAVRDMTQCLPLAAITFISDTCRTLLNDDAQVEKASFVLKFGEVKDGYWPAGKDLISRRALQDMLVQAAVGVIFNDEEMCARVPTGVTKALVKILSPHSKALFHSSS